MFDIAFINGICPDFTAGEMRKLNVAIKDGKIAYVGEDVPEATKVIDATGRVVSPGFMDIHMHEENLGLDGERYIISNHMLEMGVTTAVGGNCGNLRQSIKEFKAFIEKEGGAPVNYLILAGYNSARAKLGLGPYEPTSEEQKRVIWEDMKKEMAEGAWGLSFGIEYDPAITFEEIVEAIHAVSDDPNHIVTMHYRADCMKSMDPVDEMIRIADSIPQKFQISHLSSCSAQGQMTEALRMINEAMEKNPKLNYDTYPYNAFATKIGSEAFYEGCLEVWKKDYSDVLLTEEPYKNVRCTKEIYEDARKNYPAMQAVAFVMEESDIAMAIANEKGMIGSDGVLKNGLGHPRAAGTFPRVLGKYVREDKVISLYDALKKMTIWPADRIGLTAKGRLEVGCDGDITVFDPETIIDGATFTEIKGPVGIDYVVMEGEIVVDHGKVLNARKGKYIPYQK